MKDWLKNYGAWILRVLVVIVIVVLIWALNSAHNDKAALAKELERQNLAKANLTVEVEAKQKELTAAERLIAEKDSSFTAERAKLWKALGEKPKVVTVVEWRTVPTPTAPASGNELARECPAPDSNGKKKDILVIEGDTGHVEVSEVTYQTKNDNHVFIATGSCWRDTPTPRLVFRSAVQGPAPVALREKEALPFKWGAGVMAAASSDKFGVGPTVLFPTFETWGLQWDASIGFAVSLNGFVAASGQLGARTR